MVLPGFPSIGLKTSPLAALSSKRILSRTISIICGVVLAESLAAITCKRTVEPFGPLIKSTTSSNRQPTTSTKSSCPWATPMILSFGLIFLVVSAGPPGTKLVITVKSSSACNTAPIPSNDKFISCWKRSALRGDKYEV